MGCNSSLLLLEQKQQSQKHSIDFSVFIKANTTQVFQKYKFCSWINRSPTVMIRKVTHKNSGIQRVVKIYHRQKDNQQKAMNQINALKRLDHPNIIRLYQYFMDQSFVYIILQKIEGKQLIEQLLNDQGVKKNFPNIFKQLLNAIQHCHSHGIIHRNITNDNILIQNTSDSKYIVKLIDFAQVYFMPKSKIENREKQRLLKMKNKVIVQDYQLQQTLKINLNSKEQQEYQIRDQKQIYETLMIKNNDSLTYKQIQHIKMNGKSYEPPEVRIKSRQIYIINKSKIRKQKRIIRSQLYQSDNLMHDKIEQQTGTTKLFPFSENHRQQNCYKQKKQSRFQTQFKRAKQNTLSSNQNILTEELSEANRNRVLQSKKNSQLSQILQNNQLNVVQISNDIQSQNSLSNRLSIDNKKSSENYNMKGKQKSQQKNNQQHIVLRPSADLNIQARGKKVSTIIKKLYIRDNPKQEIYLRSQLNKLKIPVHRKINSAFDPPQEPAMDTIEKQDIWFAGIILFTLVTGKKFLAEGKTAKQIIEKLIHSWMRQNPDASYIGDLMLQMLTLSPQSRLTAYECLDHKFLKQNIETGSQWKLTMVYKFLHDYKLQHNVKSLFAMYLTRQISTIYDQTEFMLQFSNLDLNKDGKLQYDQLIQGLTNSFTIDKQCAKKYVQQIFQSLDKNKNRCIQYSQFLMGTMNMTKKIKDDNIKKLFHQIDRNGDGFISEEELNFLFQGFQKDKHFKSLMNMRKSSKKGVSIDQFTQFVKKVLDASYTT